MMFQMRTLSQSLFGRAILLVILGLIAISFVVWGIGDRFTGSNASEIAIVGTAKLSVEQYRNAYQRELQQLQQKQKRGITNEEARRLGLDRQVLSRLLSDTILDQQAQRLGLAIGDDEIVRNIVKDPSFKGPGDKFDPAIFQNLLRENGYTEASYARAQRSLMLRHDVSDALVGGLELPNMIKDAVHRYQSEVRDLDFFILPPSAAGTVPAPDEAALKTYYDEHAGSFMAPEYRKLVVLSVVPANLVKPDAITDADIAKRYDEVKAIQFTQPERRAVEQIVFADAAAADAALAKLKTGETFEQLAATEHKSPTDISLGTVAKGDLSDRAVADAAFALSENATSNPIKSQFGTVLVHVSKIFAGRQQTLMEVHAELKDQLAIIRARQQATKLRDAIEDQRTAGKTLAEAGASVGLQPRTIDAIDAQGRDRSRKPVEGLAGGPQLLKAAFASDVGADTEMIATSDGGDVWYEVAGVDAAHQLPLAEVKPRVEAGWHSEEVGRRLAAKGDELVKAIDGGKSLTATAEENGKLFVSKATNIGRGGGPQLPQLVAASFFTTVAGKAGSVTDGAQGRIVFKIEAAHVPPVDPKDQEFTKLIADVQNGFEDDVLAQYLARVQGEIGVRINQQALQAALGDSGS